MPKMWQIFPKCCGRHEKTCGDLCKHEFPGGFCEQTLDSEGGCRSSFNHAQRLRQAMKPTAWAPALASALLGAKKRGAGARRSQSRVAPQGSQRAARRRRSSAPSPGRLRGPAQEQQGNRHTKRGRRSNRMTQAGENSAGGALHPEDGKHRRAGGGFCKFAFWL